MKKLLDSFSAKQKIWFVNFVLAAIQADNRIKLSEFELFHKTIQLIEDKKTQRDLIKMLESDSQPTLTPPEDISDEDLALIYIELIKIVISDEDLDENEQSFLKKVAELFGFSPTYTNALRLWCEEGLNWKQAHLFLFSPDMDVSSKQLPVHVLNQDQRVWYAKTLISAINSEGIVDEAEIKLLKKALSFVENIDEKKKLLAYIKNKMSPPVTPPPDIPMKIVMRIFMEALYVVSINNSISSHEFTFLRSLAKVCHIPDRILDKSIEWCNQGISWKKSEKPLIKACERIIKTNLTGNNGSGWTQVTENTSVFKHKVSCFVCQSTDVTVAYRLKSKSQIPTNNIFGISVFRKSAPGFDFINFNMVRIVTCPKCYFASGDMTLFQLKPADKVPYPLSNRKIAREWLKKNEEYKAFFKDVQTDLYAIKRSITTSIKSYQQAIKTIEFIIRFEKDDTLYWKLSSLHLILAEILMTNKDNKGAEAHVNIARDLAITIFKKASNNMITFKCARLIFMVSLFHDDKQTAIQYLDFLEKTKATKADMLDKNPHRLLLQTCNEMKNAYENRSNYLKKELNGFQLKT